jgi:hypothetical protein
LVGICLAFRAFKLTLGGYLIIFNMPSRLILFFIFSCLTFGANAQVVINEVVAANISGLADEDGEYNDWIELYNKGSQTVNLQGYGLSDDKTIPLKWQFPAVTIAPGGYLTVFASEKNRTIKPLSWKTIIDKGDTWKYLIPSSDIGTAWKNVGFVDDAWNTGVSGFGKGDGDDATDLSAYASLLCVYIRKEFTLADASKVKHLYLHIDYDDSFVAYINGKEVARANIGVDGSAVAYNSSASSDHEALMYQNRSAELFEITGFESFLVSGTNVIAIEVHNNSAASSDLSLIPFLSVATDDETVANDVSALIDLPVANLHTNFKISKAGEAIYLHNASGVFADSIGSTTYYPDISFGRQPDGANDLYYFEKYTPSSANIGTAVVGGVAESVVFSSHGGKYIGGLSLMLSSANINDKIYYSTDGTIPTTSSYLFSNAIKINADTIIKARAYREGTLPGPVVTHTYVTQKDHQLPIVALSTDPFNLYDYYTGIFVKGPNAEVEEPYKGANFWQDWEKPFVFEYFTSDGESVVGQGIGAKVMGGSSRMREQKSLGLFARSDYGKGSFEFPFFAEKPIKKFESLALRNGGDDWKRSFFRDDFMLLLTKDMDVDRQATQPVAYYLNGKYWGVMSLREKVNEHFIASNHHLKADSIDILEFDCEVVYGSNAKYIELLDFISTSNLQTDENYATLKKTLDIDNFIQYQLSQIYFDNTDWPGNNIKFWCPRAEDGKWRWILFDTDFGFGLYNTTNYTNNTLEFATATGGPEWPNPEWSTLLLRRLLTSTEFKNNFIVQFCDRLNSTFLASNVNSKLDSLKTLYENEIQNQKIRWPGSCANWLYEVERISTFANNRPEYMWNYLKSYFSLGDKLNVQVLINDTDMGAVKLNSITLDQASFTGCYFYGIPITMTALPKPGYKFVRWEGEIPDDSSVITYNMTTSASFKAVFEPALPADTKVVINEINYKSADTYDTGDWVELFNAGAATVDLSDWVLTDNGKDEPYIFPNGTLLYPGDYLVVSTKLVDFKTLHSSISNSIGSFDFGLSSTGDFVILKDNNGVVKDSVNYSVTSPWPVIVDNSGATLELNNPFNDNTQGKNWKVNGTKGTPGMVNNGYTEPEVKNSNGENIKLVVYPNPVVDHAIIDLTVKAKSWYTVDLLDVNGRVVSRLLNKELSNETVSIPWGKENVSALPCGVYYIRCLSERNFKVIKVLKSN